MSEGRPGRQRRSRRARASPAWLCLATLAAGVVATPARADVELIEQELRYLVDGVTLDELRGQLASPSAWHARVGGSAVTDASIESRYWLQPRDDGRCGIGDVHVTLTLTTTLPEWRPRRRVDPDLDASMTRVVEALTLHERGHRDLMLAAAAAIEQQIAQLDAEADCTHMALEAEATLRRAVVRLRAQHMRYDRRTGNGRLQGAVLDPSPPSAGKRGRGRRAR